MSGSESTVTLPGLARAALALPAERQAIEFDKVWTTWGDMRVLADSALAALVDSGADPTRPVYFLPRNRPVAVATLLALIADERTVLMGYPFQTAAAIARSIAHLQPGAVIAGPGELGDEVLATIAELGSAAIAIDQDGARSVARATAPQAPSRGADAEEPRIFVHTSGTTGPPKQVPFPFGMFCRHHILPMMGLGPDAGFADVAAAQARFADEAPQLLTFPLGNITGLYSTMPTLLRGQRAVLCDKFGIDAWHDWVVRFRPSQGGLPPAGLQMIMDRDIPAEDLASIKSIGTGAAPLDPNVHRAFEDRYGIPILLSYGATEFAGPVAAMRPEHLEAYGRDKLGSVGVALPGVKLRVVDPDSNAELGVNEAGLLEVVSPRIGPDWIRTSDIGRIDEDGFLFLQGRADGAIMRGGFKLVPEVIEGALTDHPAIAAVAVDKRADKRLSEVPVAVIQLKAGSAWPGADELEAHVRARLPATHVPVDWLEIDELPRNRSMKLDRPALRAFIAQASGVEAG